MRLVIIGAGFAGMYAALSAARLRDIQGASPGKLEIALVAPQPTLVVRPRLYESKPETLTGRCWMSSRRSTSSTYRAAPRRSIPRRAR
jgi:NADH dehydrogenase FAD-containing subunit